MFADGPHIATKSYEVGNPTFSREKFTNLDVGVAWKGGPNRLALSAFVNRFKNYFALDASGLTRDTDGNGVGVGVTDDGFDNISDTLAYPATSILTQTAPGKAPLPGRSLKLGLQASF